MNDFYTNRILWKARKNGMIGGNCHLVADIDAHRRTQVCAQAQCAGDPVLLFWSDSSLWTLLTNREIISWSGKKTSSIALDSIQKQIELEPVEGTHPQSTKLHSQYLHVGPAGVKIWAPAGAPILSLWNILAMFPLMQGAAPAPK
ncbi:hypothetical protein F2P45_21940 [Massilia sp. CCM 8733]|uniref:Uncharacterized protein n=1 Tax=Massilia mucilaginosa TaxID=2609282 RepID=A0ABX0NY97_9BURK|nr:hypothetical protein [Massilia mucilaginosa]NHZ91646.1 hypothetical protein [Massilia mucilaginosa]